MLLGRDAHVHDGEYHEYECLQGDDEVVEPRPYDSGDELAGAENIGRHVIESRTQREAGDQQEYEFTGVHVAEQPHRQRQRPDHFLDHAEDEIDRRDARPQRRLRLVHDALAAPA